MLCTQRLWLCLHVELGVLVYTKTVVVLASESGSDIELVEVFVHEDKKGGY